MNRRKSNKSHKVPNVKLRPADPNTLKRIHARSSTSQVDGSYGYGCDQDTVIWAADSQAGGEDQTALDVTPRPFKGAVLCLSGVSDKHDLYKKAEALGAAHVAAFTDKVTHLVTPEYGSQKYYCAVERNVPILRPSWIEQSHDIWRRGDDVDLEESIATHRLKPFSGLVLAIAGVQDIVRRARIIKHVQDGGAEFVQQIERPVRVTHLLCGSDDPDLQHGEDDAAAAEVVANPKKRKKQEEAREMRRAAERFNDRGESQIWIIWEDWFWDSLSRGGRFEEQKYDIRQPRPEKLQMDEPPPPSSSPGYDHDGTSSPGPGDHPPPFKLRTTTKAPVNKPPPNAGGDDDADEVAHVRQAPAVTVQLWGSLLKHRGYEVTPRGELQLSPSRVRSRPPGSSSLGVGMDGGDMDLDGEQQDFNGGTGMDDDLDENPFANDTFEGRGNHTTYEKPAWGKSQAQRNSLLASLKRTDSFTIPEDNRRSVTPVASQTESSGFGEQPAAVSQAKRSLGRVPTAKDIFGGPRRVVSGPGTAVPAQKPPARAREAPAVASSSRLPAPDQPPALGASSSPAGSTSPPKIFLGRNLCLRGEANCAGVRDAVIELGGRVIPEFGAEEEEVDFIVVRLVSGSKLYLEEGDEFERQKYRTESWLERCMFDERICEPDDQVGFVPIGVPCPIAGASAVKLSYSGLEESEGLLVRRMGRALGIEVRIDFSKRTTHLLCPSAQGPKCEKALEWSIPVVGMSFLADMASTGRVVDADAHHVASRMQGGKVEPRTAFDTMEVTALEPPVEPIANDKGQEKTKKGKEKERQIEEPRIQDITNGHREPSVVPTSQPFQDSMDMDMDMEAGGFEPSSWLQDSAHEHSFISEGQRSPSHFPPVEQRVQQSRAAGPTRTKSDSEALKQARSKAMPNLNQSLSLSFASFGREDGIRAQSSFPKNARCNPQEDDSANIDIAEEQENHTEASSSFILKSFNLEQEKLSSPPEAQIGETIPSSATPSPMKAPKAAVDDSLLEQTSSPPGSPLPQRVAREQSIPARKLGTGMDAVQLKESIASLLGKRPAHTEDEESDERKRGAEGEGGPRAGKRPRPKVTSARTLQLEALRANTPGIAKSRSETPSAFFDDASMHGGDEAQQDYDGDGFSLEEFDAGLPRAEHDLTIRYDHTEQMEEKLKLKQLLRKETRKGTGAGPSKRAKGSRAPGF